MFSRRDILKASAIGAAAASMGGMIKTAVADEQHNTAAAGNSKPSTDAKSLYKYKFTDSKKRVLENGWAREATVEQFPISEGIAGVDMMLEPGGVRELHWHAVAAEWAYMLEGHARITIIDPEGRSEVADFGPGDVWYFPKGHGHSIQALEDGAHFILTFDNGHFSEFGTFSITDWITHMPKEVLEKSVNMPASVFSKIKQGEAYIVGGAIPPKLPLPADDGGLNDAPLTHRYELLKNKPFFENDAGSVYRASSKEFPISTTITGLIETIKPGAIRELHWHPNANEWQYYISGKGRMTVFSSHGHAQTAKYGPTDVGYVPLGFGHYIENIGNDDLQVLIVLDNGIYQDISLSDWLAKTPSYLLADNFNNNPSDWVDRPKDKLVISRRRS
ncbi:cupin domain-containing protein [Photorhabdus laumondii subsp. laumondii]|uniref:Photorhabdus luminescens subsp. laumondii TTO1 complete genome segment 8/17 n=2 Tax=Photorhabdus laumondii subsp. laumondii TaxID=141679 RepID=Q7N4K6_PHOLL|nr:MULTISPECIES: cupin domain-containing protein [Photorhabdus]AWK42089.1 oxalate decarboxylase [Photorhabdus laumondii subsp. laumondii]AXG42953.1 oxalate decarboxylase [Photorhabdus laumondii subsp. laumondii]AXG47414.1 oxalate decarboxylase [Photorhabdus laumondii subsp. laumondii]MCC8383578.1 cupin domain-containing protein [Photorhabdus laumondii]MCC8387794.1 cupin domain-containing protein [Photorhabdus laumondii]